MAGKDDSSILIDEVLEILYMVRENGKNATEKELLAIDHFGKTFDRELLERTVAEGLTSRSGDRFELTAAGLERASSVLRCHRLAERLLVDVLAVKDELLEPSACSFEHFLSEEVADSICTLLGHPKTCPHGRLIPQGNCCRHADREVMPILKPLSLLSPGDRGEVAYISSRFHERLSRLASLGISPGERLRVRQVKPSFIIAVGESEIALEKNVAEEIYVRVANDSKRSTGSRQ